MIQGELKHLQFPQSLSLNIVDESLLVVKVISQASQVVTQRCCTLEGTITLFKVDHFSFFEGVGG